MAEKKKREFNADTVAFQERVREFIAEGTQAHVLLERARCMRCLIAVLNEEHADLKTALEKAKRMIEGGSGSAFTTRDATDLDDFAIRVGRATLDILSSPASLEIVPWGEGRSLVIVKDLHGKIVEEQGEDLRWTLEKLAEKIPKKPYVPKVQRASYGATIQEDDT